VITEGRHEVDEFLAMLGDRDPRVRCYALRMLAAIGTTTHIPDVRRTAVDRDPMVAFQAGQTLQALLARGSGLVGRGRSPAQAAEGTATVSVQSLRAAGLSLLLPYVERLGAMVASAATNLARVAAAALGKVGDVRAVDFLAEGLKREDVAADCAVALSTIGDPACLDLLLSLFDSRNDRLVQHAVYAAGVFNCPRVVTALERLLAHPVGHVRADAALVLGTIGDESVAEPIYDLLDDEDERVVIKALEVLVRLAPQRFVEFVDVRFGASSERLRATMVALLEHAGAGDGTLDVLGRALVDGDARVRANAVEVVGALRLLPERRLALLETCRGDHNNRVLANLAVALSSVDIVASLEILSSLLASPNKWERASAVFAAGFIEEEKVAMWLANVFVLEEDPDVVGNAVTSLSRCGGADVAERMEQSLRHFDTRIRAGAAKVLGMVARKGARRTLAREALFAALGRERDVTVLTAILQALPGLADTSHVRLLNGCLRHPSAAVQASAIEALDAIGTIEILPYVEPFIFSADGRVKASATLALWKQGYLDVVHVVGQMLEQRDDELEAASAAFVVGEIGLTLYRLDDFQRSYVLTAALAARADRPSESATVVAVRSDGDGTVQLDDVTFLEAAVPAIVLVGDGNPEAAADVLRRVLVERPDEPRIHYLLASIYRRCFQRERALAHYQVAAAGMDDFADLMMELASLQHELGDPPAALRSFKEAARVRAVVIERMTELAGGMLDDGRLQDASLTVKLVIESFADGTLHRSVGLHLARFGEPAAALAHLTRALMAAPNDRELRQPLALMLRRLGHERLAADIGRPPAGASEDGGDDGR